MRFLISPYFLILYQFILMLIPIFFINNKTYSFYINEPDLMYLNLKVYLFIFINILSFSIAYLSINIKPKITFFNFRLKRIYLSPNLYFLPLLIFFEVAVGLFIVIFLKQNSDILPLLFIDMTLYKESFKGNFFYFSNYLLMGVLLYTIYQKYYFKIKGKLINLFILLGILEILIATTLLAARYLLIPFTISLFVIMIFFKKVDFKKFILLIIIFISLLILITWLRTGAGVTAHSDKSIDLIVKQIMGYTIASYNRLAAILGSKLHFTYENTGFYLFPALSHIPIFHKILPNFFGVDGTVDVTKQEFVDVAVASLNENYIWATLYGYIASTLGWASVVYFYLLGLLYGILWKQFKNQKIFGIIIYPWAYACLILVFSSNLLFMPTFISFIYSAIVIMFWNSLFTFNIVSNEKVRIR